MKGRLLALLEGTDPSVRVGLALGLAESAHKPAVTWLASAYAREEDVYVRRALVASLAVRSETQREAPLKLARDLDPDAEVRAIAAAGLASEPLPASIAQGGVDPSLAALFAVVGADGSKEARALRLVLPSGMAVPMVTSTDGALFVVGVPYGRGSLELERSAGDEK
ncbi:MAG: HEAT repeat domain-containing protein [Polyangiaceae bacterium]|nr:HEAT repeat domain-containing protein [Polyangiaceae bacterium]